MKIASGRNRKHKMASKQKQKNYYFREILKQIDNLQETVIEQLQHVINSSKRIQITSEKTKRKQCEDVSLPSRTLASQSRISGITSCIHSFAPRSQATKNYQSSQKSYQKNTKTNCSSINSSAMLEKNIINNREPLKQVTKINAFQFSPSLFKQQFSINLTEFNKVKKSRIRGKQQKENMIESTRLSKIKENIMNQTRSQFLPFTLQSLLECSKTQERNKKSVAIYGTSKIQIKRRVQKLQDEFEKCLHASRQHSPSQKNQFRSRMRAISVQINLLKKRYTEDFY